MFDTKPKKDIILKKYPTYTLVGRIHEEDIPEYKATKNPELILYRFCCNGPKYVPVNEDTKRNIPGNPLNPR